MKSHFHPRVRAQDGAASLIVVMLLFFLMMLVTAYASRSMVFEQRTSANQYRSTQASDAAEAGLQWALALLNGQHIDANCLPTTAAGSTSFRDRYLDTDDQGVLLPKLMPGLGVPQTVAACVMLASGWSCQCPVAGEPQLDALLSVPPLPTGPTPSFGIMVATTGRIGSFSLRVAGCSGVDQRCQPKSGLSSDAVALREVQVALRGLANPPIAALTVKGDVIMTAPLRIINTDPAGSGMAAHIGGTRDTPVAQFIGAPGTLDPILVDPGLVVEDNIFFASFFGVSPAMFPRLPGVFRCAADCADAVAGEALLGRRLFWIDGDLTLPADAVLGSPVEPVMLLVRGRVTLAGAAQVFGVLEAGALTWNGAGGTNAFVRGATLIRGNCCEGAAAAGFVYDKAVLKRLSTLTGPLLQVPGSWQDTF